MKVPVLTDADGPRAAAGFITATHETQTEGPSTADTSANHRPSKRWAKRNELLIDMHETRMDLEITVRRRGADERVHAEEEPTELEGQERRSSGEQAGDDGTRGWTAVQELWGSSMFLCGDGFSGDHVSEFITLPTLNVCNRCTSMDLAGTFESLPEAGTSSRPCTRTILLWNHRGSPTRGAVVLTSP